MFHNRFKSGFLSSSFLFPDARNASYWPPGSLQQHFVRLYRNPSFGLQRVFFSVSGLWLTLPDPPLFFFCSTCLLGLNQHTVRITSWATLPSLLLHSSVAVDSHGGRRCLAKHLAGGEVDEACGTSWPHGDALINPHTKRNRETMLLRTHRWEKLAQYLIEMLLILY